MNMKCQLTYLDPGVGTHFTETIRVSELGSGYKILIINTTFYCKKRLQWSTVCDVVRKKTHFSIYKYKLDSTAQW